MIENSLLNELLKIRKKTMKNIFLSSLDRLVTLATFITLHMLHTHSGEWTADGLGEELFCETHQYVAIYNGQTDGPKLRYSGLLPMQIAHLINLLYCVKRIPCAGEKGNVDLDLLGIYQDTGPKAGLYETADKAFREPMRKLKPTITDREIAEAIHVLRDIAQRVGRTQERDLVPVNNGIFDYKTKQLIPYNPEYIFLAKAAIDYNSQAQNVVIQNPDGTSWDVESWMASLSDDPAVVELLWQILGAVIRPFVRWGKCVMMYATTGNNGKGTLCELMRSLCGEGRYASIPVENFGENFLLEKLPEVMAVIVDENNVGTYLDRAGPFKAAVTNDVIQINRKNKPAIPYQFWGVMVQCFNELPRIKDKSESIYRRCLFVPFDKCFTGSEKKYIKSDYLHRPEVLAYVMFKVLNMNYYEFSEPAVCKNILADYKVYNDPVRQWWNEVSDQLVWDLLPWEFLYALYKQWCKESNPSGKIASKRGFIDQMREIAEKDAIWMCPYIVDKDGRKKDKQISPRGRITCNEPLGGNVGYGFDDWGRWQGTTYRGLLRRVPTPRPQPQVQATAMTNRNPQDCGQTISYEELYGSKEHNPAS